MALAFRAATTATWGASATGVTVIKPTGTIDTDFLIVGFHFVNNSTQGSWPAFTNVQGFTNQENVDGDAGWYAALRSYSKTASSEGASWAFAWNASPAAHSGTAVCIAVSGTSISVDADAGQRNSGAGNNIAAPAVTATVAASLLVCLFSGTDGSGSTAETIAPPGSMTERAEATGSEYSKLSIATEAITGTGSTGTRTATWTGGATQNTLAISILLKEGGGGGGGATSLSIRSAWRRSAGGIIVR